MLHPLEALALASLPEPILVKKLAALWCSHYGNSAPTSGADILQWVLEDFGEVVKKSREKAIRLALGQEVKRQVAIRKRRAARKAGEDILELDPRDGKRLKSLLDSILGAPRKWVSPLRTGTGAYAQFCITSGLVAALIPTTIRLRALKAPSLLVYRQPGDRARSYWVPGNISRIDNVLLWLIPQRLHQPIKQGLVRVEHDGRHKKVRAISTDGSVKLVSWRKLREYND
jgi:hypothetical protein